MTGKKQVDWQNNELIIVFSGDDFKDVLTIVKTLEGRYFDAVGKYWKAKDSLVNRLTLKNAGFEFTYKAEHSSVLATEQVIIKTKPMLTTFPRVFELKERLPEFRQYQLEGINFVEKRGSGLIADEMGLGKTAQAIGYLKVHPEALPALIVCPAALKFQWRDQIKEWYGFVEGIDILEGETPKLKTLAPFTIINYDILDSWLPTLCCFKFNSIIGDECFPYETKVLTDKGFLNIGDIVENTINCKVFSYNFSTKKLDIMPIIHYNKKVSINKKIKFTFKEGSLLSTDNHKIWSIKDGKFKRADEFKPGDYVLSLLQKKLSYKKMGKKEVLFKQLSCKSYVAKTWAKGKIKPPRKNIKNNAEQKKMGSKRKISIVFKKQFGKNETKQSKQEPRYYKKSKSNQGRKRYSSLMVCETRRKRNINRTTNKITTYFRTKLGNGICSFNNKRTEAPIKSKQRIQNRYCKSFIKNSNRSRWERAQFKKGAGKRSEKKFNLIPIRVESITVLELPNNERYRNCKKTDYVYNLEIEKNHNYFANNILVSNCQYIQNSKAKRTTAFKTIAGNIEHKIFLSGTPIRTRTSQFFNCLNLLAPDAFPHEYRFLHRYCDPKVENIWGKAKGGRPVCRRIWTFKGSTNWEELRSKLTTIMIRREKSEVLKELPPKQKIIVPLPANKKVYEQYLVEENGFKVWAEREKKAHHDKKKMIVEHLKQAAYLAKREAVIQWIKDYIENDRKFVVFAIHTQAVLDLYNAFPGQAVMVDGSVKERETPVKQFWENPEIKLFVGQIDAAGLGLNLQCASAMGICEFPWTPSVAEQAEDRIHRLGQEASSIECYYFCADRTIDLHIASMLIQKNKDIKRLLSGRENEQFFGEQEILDELFKKYGIKDEKI